MSEATSLGDAARPGQGQVTRCPVRHSVFTIPRGAPTGQEEARWHDADLPLCYVKISSYWTPTLQGFRVHCLLFSYNLRERDHDVREVSLSVSVLLTLSGAAGDQNRHLGGLGVACTRRCLSCERRLPTAAPESTCADPAPFCSLYKPVATAFYRCPFTLFPR